MLDTLGFLLMRIVFFCILTPIALLMRLFGYDPLSIKATQSISQWSARQPIKFDQKFFHKQG